MARTRTKKVLLGCASLVVLAALSFVVMARRFLFRRHYDVVPISAATDYQDGAELGRAFSLPVAASYERARAVSRIGPVAATPRTRPPAVNHSPPLPRAVAA